MALVFYRIPVKKDIVDFRVEEETPPGTLRDERILL
jgi:hypothetical protein